MAKALAKAKQAETITEELHHRIEGCFQPVRQFHLLLSELTDVKGDPLCWEGLRAIVDVLKVLVHAGEAEAEWLMDQVRLHLGRITLEVEDRHWTMSDYFDPPKVVSVKVTPRAVKIS